MTRIFRPVSPGRLTEAVADILATSAAGDRAALRVAVDGSPSAGPLALAESLVDPLRLRGHDAVVIDARTFWRDASLRLELGREDVDSFPDWLDTGALSREVLRAARRPEATILPALRDPDTNRSVRLPRRAVSASTVVLVAGALLLGRGLPFDLTIHLAMSAAPRRRRTDEQWRWTLPAYDRYDDLVTPLDSADVVIRVDDPRHPAIG